MKEKASMSVNAFMGAILFAVAVTATATWFIARNPLMSPTTVVTPAPVVATAVPQAAVLIPTSVAVDKIVFESLWTAGGADFQKKVGDAADAYASKMDANCEAQASVAPVVAAYSGFVPRGTEAVFAGEVRAMVRTMACEKMNGARAAAILDS